MAEQVKDRPGPGPGMESGAPAGRGGERDQARPAGDSMRETAADLRQQASSVAQQAREQGKAALTWQKDSAAQQVDAVADALQQTAQQLSSSADRGDRSHAQIGRYVGYAAEQVANFGDQLRGKDLDTLLDDAIALGRRAPGTLFAGAMVAGFLLARFLKSSSQDDESDEPRRGGFGRGGDDDSYGRSRGSVGARDFAWGSRRSTTAGTRAGGADALTTPTTGSPLSALSGSRVAEPGASDPNRGRLTEGGRHGL